MKTNNDIFEVRVYKQMRSVANAMLTAFAAGLVIILLTGCASRTRSIEAAILRMQISQAGHNAHIEHRMMLIERKVERLEFQGRKSETGKEASARTREQIRQNLEDSAQEYGRVSAGLNHSIREALLK
jgi:hypothetical protein